MDERRDDWRHGVDENLASLNAGQRVWEKDLAKIREKQDSVDGLLRGDTEKETDGVIARLHATENALLLLKAILLKDAAGGKGLVGRVEALESGERTAGDRWKFATAVTVAIISLAGLIFSNLDRLAAFVNRKSRDPLDQMIEKAKRPKPHRKIDRHIEKEPPEEPDQ